MPSELWAYDSRARRFRQQETGRFLSPSQQKDLRDRYIDARQQDARRYARQLAEVNVGLDGWLLAMRDLVREVYVTEALLGRGGRNAMTAGDYERLGPLISNQYDFLQSFAVEVGEGKLTQAQIGARSAMYVDSGSHAYEQARAAAHGGLTLPAYPGDGQQTCLSSCRCMWQITETEEAFEARWQTMPGADHCGSCQENARRWNPLVIAKAEVA